MKRLKSLKGAKELDKVEQKAIKGGKKMCYWSREDGYYCFAPFVCINGICVLSPE